VAVLLVAAMVLAVSVSGNAWKRRAVERQIEADADESDRYVDMGVLLSVVAMDLERGHELEPGKPPVRILRQHRLGGMLDTWTRKIVGPSERPRYWQCSPAQEPLIIHDDTRPVWSLIQGSEGAGKTVSLPMWLYCRVIEHCGHDREIGVTAPVFSRLAHVKKAIATLWDARWYRWKERDQSYRFRAGPVVQLVSAHQQSENAGSPIQGANWVACASDELQDHHDREADIVARGRSAPGGKYKRLCTSTFKDSTEWRDFRGVAEKAPDWTVTRMLGLESPFVWPAHWERFRNNGITAREYQRRVLAMDVGPEAQLYHCWSRSVDGAPANLRPVPLGAEDVTAEMLAPYAAAGERLSILVGHDPGKRQHVSMFLKAYRFRADKIVRWFVVDEVTTVDATIEKHVDEVLARARTKWHAHQLDRRNQADPTSGRMLVRADPHTRSGDDHPDATMYTVWRARGVKVRAAAYKPGSTEPGVIKREARFNLINTLLCDVNGVRRLLVACDDTGKAAAPHLVKALETMERNAEDKGEHEKKNGDDLSHWPAAVGYALWQIEHPRLAAVAS
jgi:hypothetical protein